MLYRLYYFILRYTMDKFGLQTNSILVNKLTALKGNTSVSPSNYQLPHCIYNFQYYVFQYQRKTE